MASFLQQEGVLNTTAYKQSATRVCDFFKNVFLKYRSTIKLDEFYLLSQKMCVCLLVSLMCPTVSCLSSRSYYVEKLETVSGAKAPWGCHDTWTLNH